MRREEPMRLEELMDPVTDDVIGEMLAEVGPLAPDAGRRTLENWMKAVAARIKELEPVDRARARPRVLAALGEVAWLAEVLWERSMFGPYFQLVAIPPEGRKVVVPFNPWR